MPWVEVFVVFYVSHLVGDYMLQTDWQAMNKHGALTGTPTMRRALGSHIASYTLAFVPALIWLWPSRGPVVIALGAAIAIPHLIQDDGTLLDAYAIKVKRADIQANPSLAVALDQSFHVLALFVVALIAGR